MSPFPEALVGAFERIDLDVEDYPIYFELLDALASMEEIDKTDHLTFITPWEHTEAFLKHWKAEGFEFHGEWNTKRYPARHLALIRGAKPGHPWADMVGLSVSKEPNSPIERSLAAYEPAEFSITHTLQHVALHVRSDADMHQVRAQLAEAGVPWMTEVLSYQDPNGAELHQLFTAPNPRGFFVEFAQRKPNADGEPYGGFDPDIIDDLYEALDRSLAGAEA